MKISNGTGRALPLGIGLSLSAAAGLTVTECLRSQGAFSTSSAEDLSSVTFDPRVLPLGCLEGLPSQQPDESGIWEQETPESCLSDCESNSKEDAELSTCTAKCEEECGPIDSTS